MVKLLAFGISPRIQTSLHWLLIYLFEVIRRDIFELAYDMLTIILSLRASFCLVCNLSLSFCLFLTTLSSLWILVSLPPLDCKEALYLNHHR